MKTTTVLLLAFAATAAAAQTTPAAPATPAATSAAPVNATPATPSAAAPAAKATKLPLVNPGFESTKPGRDGAPEGWMASQHTGEVSYDFALDSGVKKTGTQSLRITNIGPEPFGIVSQTLPATALGGRTVRLSAWVKAEKIPEGGRRNGATMLIIAKRGSQVVASEAMRKREIQGTSDWTKRSIELAVPARSTELEVGISLQGGGKVWVDDYELEVLDP